MKRLLFMIVAIGAFCSPVLATAQDQNGWTDAKWGMTGPELEKAFAGKIKPNAEGGYEIDSYAIDRLTFGVNFYMGGAGLKKVRLMSQKSNLPLDDDYRKLAGLLEQKYGPAIAKDIPDKFPAKSEVFNTSWGLPATKITLGYLRAYVAPTIGLYSITISYEAQGSSTKDKL
ncbi:exported hypothetical protein [Syntrophobacter sp. SbD1]|nr:exported hypothetical protein [Syntrophobacter sp. SbD1]